MSAQAASELEEFRPWRCWVKKGGDLGISWIRGVKQAGHSGSMMGDGELGGLEGKIRGSGLAMESA